MLTTVTSRSHDLRVPDPTITNLLGIADFGIGKKNDSEKKDQHMTPSVR